MNVSMARHLILTFLMLIFGGAGVALNAQSNLYDCTQIQEIHIQFSQPNWRTILDSLFVNYGEDGRMVCDVTVNEKKFSKAGIRFKGFSSYDDDRVKNPFNIDLDYTYKHNSYQGYTKLKLGNVIYDPSFVREVVSYKIAQKYMPASQAAFAKLYVNGDYLGLYTLVQAVDDNFNLKFFESEENCFIKGSPEALQYPFGQNANLAYTHGADSSGYMPFYKLESKLYGWNELFEFIEILNNDTARIPEILNVDRALWMHALNYALMNLDSYIGYSQNYYLYKDDNGRFNTIPWDFNMAFGSFRNSDGISLNLTIDKVAKLDPLQHLLYNAYTPRPLMKKLFVVPRYKKMYLAHLRTIVKENFETNAYFDIASECQTLIDSAVLADTNKFYTYDDFKNNLTVDAGPTSGRIPGLKSIVDARIAYLSTYLGFSGYPTISQVAHSPEIVEQNDMVWITAQVTNGSEAILAYRNGHKALFNEVPMFDDGNHQDGGAGDGVFGAGITAAGKTLQYYIWVENDSTGSFSPERAQYEFYSIQPQLVSGDVVINELKMNTTTTTLFETGSWVELFNNTNETLSLCQIYLSNDSANLLKWRLPDSTIAPKSYFLIGLENAYANDSANTDFSISEINGLCYLTYENGKKIDELKFSQLTDNLSIGRYPNGKGPFSMMKPTCAGFNAIPQSERVTFSVYPNPTLGVLNFEAGIQKSTLTVEVYNALSQPLFRQQYEVDSPNSFYNNSIDIATFAKGVYFLKATWDNNSEIIKIIKQ